MKKLILIIFLFALIACEKYEINPEKTKIGLTVEHIEAIFGPPNKSRTARQYHSNWPPGEYLIYTYWFDSGTYIYYFKNGELFYIEKL